MRWVRVDSADILYASVKSGHWVAKTGAGRIKQLAPPVLIVHNNSENGNNSWDIIHLHEAILATAE